MKIIESLLAKVNLIADALGLGPVSLPFLPKAKPAAEAQTPPQDDFLPLRLKDANRGTILDIRV